MIKSFFYALLSCCLIPFLISCANVKSVIYFNNIQDSTILVNVNNAEPVIQKNDLLSIIVSSPNPELTTVFNASNMAASAAAGYLVNQEGNIQFPLLGTIKAAGITKKTLQETILKSLVDQKLLLNPTVDVRYLNYKVFVLGEVGHPSAISVPSEKINLLQAISLAGDLTMSAKRDNIMLIREEEGRKIIKRLSLSSSDLFTSPYYNLQSNDIIYVEPNKIKIESNSRFNQIFPVVISSISILLLIIDRVVK